MYNIDIIDANTAWISNNGGGLLHTTDGGTTWTNQVVGFTSFGRVHVQMINATTGWIVTSLGDVFKTSNGGSTWTKTISTFGHQFQCIVFLDTNTGWLLSSSAILKTTDGGTTWEHQKSSSLLTDIHFSDPNNGWIVGVGGEVYHTTDGGTNWASAKKNNVIEIFHQIYFFDVNTGWIVGESGTILHTSNGGTTWTTQTSNTTTGLAGIYFIDALTGWCIGSNTVLKTTNGGTTWTNINSSIPGLNGIYFKDASTGWIGASGGKVYKTTDGGSTWTLQTTLGGSVRNFSFGDANTAFGALLSSSLMHSSDGGDTWSAMPTGSSELLYDTYATDANNCWAVGNNGVIYNTTNGGTTWTQQISNTTNRLQAVHFIDANTGWAVGFFGTILKTTTGGVLPVELTSFKGEHINSANHLRWQTASEQNNEGFLVELGIKNYELGIIEWEEIGFVEGNGTTAEVSNYEFIDDLNRVGFENRHGLYYRLKQIDFDGKYEYSDIINIAIEQSNDETVNIYPNPVSDILNIEISTPTIIQITNVNGQILKELQVETNSKINIADIPTGIYFLKVGLNTQKIIVQR